MTDTGGKIHLWDVGSGKVRRIVASASNYLAPDGWLLIEHGYNQAESVQALLVEAGYSGIGSRRNMAGILRVTFAHR